MQFSFIYVENLLGCGRISILIVFAEAFQCTSCMAELFGVKTQAITKHLGNIYEEEGLIREATCSKKEQVQIEGVREVRRIVDFYNLDAMLYTTTRLMKSK